MGIILFLLFTKHLIVDFFLQTNWQASNKGTFGHPGGLVHSGLHGFATAGLFLALGASTWWLMGLVDAVSHYLIDWSKVNLTKKLGLTFKNPGYWWLLGIDQYLHTIMYFVILYLSLIINF